MVPRNAGLRGRTVRGLESNFCKEFLDLCGDRRKGETYCATKALRQGFRI